MIRTFVKGNYFFIVDDDDIEYEGLAKDVLVRRLSTTDPKFSFSGVNFFSDQVVYDITDILKEDGSAYTLKEFLAFKNTYLGLSGGGSVAIVDGPNLDGFSRLRVSQPQAVSDAQLTYDLQPTIYEQIATGSGAAIAHDATNRQAVLTFASTPTGGAAYMQSFEYFRYQPLKSQLIAVTFTFKEAVANVLKFAGYSDRVNGIEFQNNGTTNRFAILSATGNGNEIVNQADWNLDRLDGDGTSGYDLDISKTQILIIDFQALYVGRVRMGFDIGGKIVYCHEFLHANEVTQPYLQTANLPIICGMTCTGTVSTTMNFICSAIASEGGQELTSAFDFTQDVTGTAGNNADAHIVSIRPRLLFNNIANRVKIGFVNVSILVTGTRPIQWSVVLGQAITGASYANANATYSACEFTTAGTLSGTPAIELQSGYVPASASVKGESSTIISTRYPITLDAAGQHRALGTITLLAKGIGGTSDILASIKWTEVR